MDAKRRTFWKVPPESTTSCFSPASAQACAADAAIVSWTAAGLPVESGPGTMLAEADDVVQKPYERGRAAMEAYLRWEEALDRHGVSPHALLPESKRA